MDIKLEDLVGNEAGIKMLINQHNNHAQKRAEAERRLADTQSELEFLKTSPFLAIVAMVVGVIGAIVLGLGISLLFKDKPTAHSWFLSLLGGALIVLSGVTYILYPYAHRWLNRG